MTGQTIGVVGGDINSNIVNALTHEYDLTQLKITFKNVAFADARQAIQSGNVGALLMVLPLARKYLSYVNAIFRGQSDRPPSVTTRPGCWRYDRGPGLGRTSGWRAPGPL